MSTTIRLRTLCGCEKVIEASPLARRVLVPIAANGTLKPRTFERVPRHLLYEHAPSDLPLYVEQP